MPYLLLLLLLSIAISAWQKNKAEGNFQVPFLHNYPVLHMPRKRGEANPVNECAPKALYTHVSYMTLIRLSEVETAGGVRLECAVCS